MATETKTILSRKTKESKKHKDKQKTAEASRRQILKALGEKLRRGLSPGG